MPLIIYKSVESREWLHQRLLLNLNKYLFYISRRRCVTLVDVAPLRIFGSRNNVDLVDTAVAWELKLILLTFFIILL